MAVRSLLLVSSWALSAAAGSLADIDHVVLFMQENRAFNHYFGTMAGVRGFKDPNVHINSGKQSAFYQVVDSSLSNATDTLLPFYLNYLGGNWTEATQCMYAGSNGWGENHLAYNGGANNHWATNNTPWSWGYFKRSDVPVHFGIAEGWTVGDMYQESVVASTNPNRVSWASGSINAPGGPQSSSQGGPYIDNNESPGCESGNINCYPLKWKTHAEYLEDAGVSWQVYQDVDNFDDNPLAWFKQFQDAKSTSSLGKKGMSFVGLNKFYSDAKLGKLPQVSYIVGPAELSEHPPYQPKDGAWLQQQVVNAVVNGANWNKTALIISYDETGGWGDAVVPFHGPAGTAGEWLEDPYNNLGQVFTGPGFRLPFYIISPWTRGGNVFTERADHSSQIKFLEEWLKTKGKNVVTSQIPAWRRAHMSDLSKAFDFNHPDYSIPSIPLAETPSVDPKTGLVNGYAICQDTYAETRPPVPYGKQTPANSLVTEQGYKSVRGQLTEGRYLVFESGGYAIAALKDCVDTQKATAKHDSKSQRWILYQTSDNGPGVAQLILKSVSTNKFLAPDGKLTSSESKAAQIKIVDLGNGKGYTIQQVSGGKYASVAKGGKLEFGSSTGSWKIYSVTY